MELTEDGLLSAVRKVLSGAGPEVVVPIGDDAAVVRPGSGDLVLTTDALVEGTHFDRGLSTAHEIGYKAIAVNVSDIAAMAASPRYALCALTLSGDLDAAWAMELFGGMREACGEFACTLVGGNLARGREITVAVTLTGEVAPGRAVTRSGARPGQAVVVTGLLGGAAAGLRFARRGPPWDEQERDAILRLAKPVPRVGEAQLLAGRGATAMIDVSDGLAIDLSRLCAAGGVGVRLELARVPVHPAATLPDALGGGEDYELVATLPPAGGRRRGGRARPDVRHAAHADRLGDRRGLRRHGPGRSRARARARRLGPLRVSAAPRRARALTIAGSDSGGGAGIQADLKTFSVLGVYGMTAITAVTVQDTRGVRRAETLAPEVVAEQIAAVASDIGVDAAKTGMLATAAIAEAVAEAVVAAGIGVLVVDPVSVSKHGDPLLAPDAVGALRLAVLPLATLVTPNLPEASSLAGIDVRTHEDMRRAADAILELGAGAVLVKGGHLDEDRAADLFVDAGGEEWVVADRIDTPNTHGTGCTLSAAITAHLAKGATLRDAVLAGKAFVTEAIRSSLAIGGGIGPVDQLWPIEP